MERLGVQRAGALGQPARERAADERLQVGQVLLLGHARRGRPAADNHARQSELACRERFEGQRGVVERAEAGGDDQDQRCVKRGGEVRDRGARAVVPDEQSARALHQHQVPVGGQVGGERDSPVDTDRREAGPAGSRLGGERVGEAGELVGVGQAGEPPDGLGIGDVSHGGTCLRGLDDGHPVAAGDR